MKGNTPYWHHDALYVHRDDLKAIHDELPPDVEMRVLSLLRAARHEIVVLQRAEEPTPHQMSYRDANHVVEALTRLIGRAIPDRVTA